MKTITTFSTDEVKALFNDAKLLTFSIFRGWYDEGNDMDTIYLNSDLLKENKFLQSKIAKYSLNSDTSLAFFSNGKLIINKYTNQDEVDSFIKIVNQNGDKITQTIISDNESLYKINDYARKIYKSENKICELQEKKSFINNLFKINNICLTASNQLIFNPEARESCALFANGRFIVSEIYRNNFTLGRMYRENIVKKFSDNYIFLSEEIVPQSYIDAIYQYAKNYDWFLEDSKLQELFDEQNSGDKEKISSIQVQEMHNFIEKLLKNNKCLTVIDLSKHAIVEKNNLAFFEDGRLIINQNAKNKGSVLNFETVIKKNWPNMEIKKENVPAYYLKEIYKKVITLQKSCHDIYVEMLKKKAKRLVDAENISHHEALEEVAKLNNFNNWKEVTNISEEKAQYNISQLEGKNEELNFRIDMYLMKNGKQDSKEEVLQKLAKEYGFANTARLEACGLKKLIEKTK